MESIDNKDLTCFSLTSNFPRDAKESIGKNYEWIIDPFSVTSKPAILNAIEYEVLIDMVLDSHYHQIYLIVSF